MLDIKFVRENLDAVQAMLSNRQNKLSLDGFKELEEKRLPATVEQEDVIMYNDWLWTSTAWGR